MVGDATAIQSLVTGLSGWTSQLIACELGRGRRCQREGGGRVIGWKSPLVIVGDFEANGGGGIGVSTLSTAKVVPDTFWSQAVHAWTNCCGIAILEVDT